MRALLAGVVVAASLLVAPASPVVAAQSFTPGDNDSDGINDDLEQRLANEFAPVVLME